MALSRLVFETLTTYCFQSQGHIATLTRGLVGRLPAWQWRRSLKRHLATDVPLYKVVRQSIELAYHFLRRILSISVELNSK